MLHYTCTFTCENPQRFCNLNGLSSTSTRIHLPFLNWRQTLKIAEPTEIFFYLGAGEEYHLEYLVPGYMNPDDDHGFVTDRYMQPLYEEPYPARVLRWIYEEYSNTGHLYRMPNIGHGEGSGGLSWLAQLHETASRSSDLQLWLRENGDAPEFMREYFAQKYAKSLVERAP